MKWTAYTYMLLVSTASILVTPHRSHGQELFLLNQGLQETLIQPDYSVDFIPDFTYDEVAERIRTMETDMPFTLNERVYSFIDYFAVRNRDYVRMILAREVQYFPLFDEVLRRHDMPEDIKYLAIIESA
ncbi:hypothetical protein [Nitritalea halalkaliphila]|uniref:hypothetical protein n=1 Tax=Nitritalea halalkaliphila TaxID=590849 RepID=UPI001EE6558C|nr:hypothetical protein [Nitritalea halalkaliphila]